MKKFLNRFTYGGGTFKGIGFSIAIGKETDSEQIDFVVLFLCFGFSLSFK